MKKKELKQFIEELGCNNVKSISFNESKGRWVVDYETEFLLADEFTDFRSLYDFLATEVNGE